MFTGLIREIATAKSYKNNILTIQSKHKAKLGDSIAINGVCLTVIKVNSDGFDLELADETRSIIDESKISGQVHMEPAMMMNDRFEGHIVQGHVDGTATVDRGIASSRENRIVNSRVILRNTPLPTTRRVKPPWGVAQHRAATRNSTIRGWTCFRGKPATVQRCHPRILIRFEGRGPRAYH